VTSVLRDPPPDPSVGRPIDQVLDLVGEVCPFTLVRAKLALEALPLAGTLEIVVDLPEAAENVPRALHSEGQEILCTERRPDDRYRIVVRKHREPPLLRTKDPA
jgi:tRNA 2-thiouridine synthesizing protein A